MKEILTTKSSAETQKFASNFACKISAVKPGFTANKKAMIIGLTGELGSGKTVFAKGFAKGLGVKEPVASPTFVIERVYKLKTKNFKFFIHIDAYRVEKSKEISDLEFKDLTRNPENIILIEWADRIKSILPKDCVQIKFKHINKNKRKIWISRKTK